MGSGDPPPKLFQEISLHSDAPDGVYKVRMVPSWVSKKFRNRCDNVKLI